MSKRKDGLTPEEIARVVEEYKKRKEQRMQQSSQMVADEEGSEENPQENQDEGEGTASDPVQDVKDRRDRRDASGDCETMDEANGVIAQQDEDIQNCWTLLHSCRQRSTLMRRPKKTKAQKTMPMRKAQSSSRRRKRRKHRSIWTASNLTRWKASLDRELS